MIRHGFAVRMCLPSLGTSSSRGTAGRVKHPRTLHLALTAGHQSWKWEIHLASSTRCSVAVTAIFLLDVLEHPIDPMNVGRRPRRSASKTGAGASTPPGWHQLGADEGSVVKGKLASPG